MSPSNFIANTITSPPTPYPQVKVGGEAYELRFSLTSGFFLEENCDIPAQEQTNWINEKLQKKQISTLMRTIAAVMLGREVNGKWVPMPMLPSEFAARVQPDEWVHIMNCYSDAIKKASEAMQAALAALPPKTDEPTAEIVN